MTNFIKSYKNLNVRSKAAIWFICCSFLQKGISFITVPIFTRLLSTDEYGTYTLYLSWVQVLTIFTSLYLYNGVLDNAMSKYDKDRDRFISSIQGLTTLIWIISLAIFLLLYRFTEQIIGLSLPYIFLMFIEMFFTPSTNFWMGRQRFEYSYVSLVIVTLIKSLLNPFMGLLLVYVSSNKGLARVESVVLAEASVGCILLIYQYIKGKCFYIKEYWAYAIRLALPMLPHYLSGVILNQGDRIMINIMVGRKQVAYYGVAYSIGMIVQIFVTAINSAITPWMYKKCKDNRLKDVQGSLTFLMLIVAAVAVLMMLFAPEVIYIFGSKKYMEAVYVIPPVAASVYFIFLYSVLSFPQFYYEKTKFLMLASLFAAGANIVLNYIFIKAFGYVAAGYTTLACYILYAIGHYYVSKKILKKEKAGLNSVVNTKAAFAISIVLMTAVVCTNVIIKLSYIRYAVLGIVFIILFIYRKAILVTLKTLNNER